MATAHMEDACSSQDTSSGSVISTRRRFSSTYHSRTQYAPHRQSVNHSSPAQQCESDKDEPAATPTKLSAFPETCLQHDGFGIDEYELCHNEEDCNNAADAGAGEHRAVSASYVLLSQHSINEKEEESSHDVVTSSSFIDTKKRQNKERGDDMGMGYDSRAAGHNNNFTIKQPVIFFLSSLQMQGYARRVVEECGVTTMFQLVDKVSCEKSAAELLGGYASMQHRRQLVKGVRRWAREQRDARAASSKATKMRRKKAREQQMLDVDTSKGVLSSSSSFSTSVLPRPTESSFFTAAHSDSVTKVQEQDRGDDGSTTLEQHRDTPLRVCDTEPQFSEDDVASDRDRFYKFSGTGGVIMRREENACGCSTATGMRNISDRFHVVDACATACTETVSSIDGKHGKGCSAAFWTTLTASGESSHAMDRNEAKTDDNMDILSNNILQDRDKNSDKNGSNHDNSDCGARPLPPQRRRGGRCPVAFMQSLRYTCYRTHPSHTHSSKADRGKVAQSTHDERVVPCNTDTELCDVEMCSSVTDAKRCTWDAESCGGSPPSCLAPLTLRFPFRVWATAVRKSLWLVPTAVMRIAW